MKVSRRHLKAMILGAVAIAVSLGYLTISIYQEMRIFLSSKQPKVLASRSEDPQCRLADQQEDNPNKFLFVSCSGFYDEE